MNKQSNVYTLIYIIVLVVVVGAALALISNALKSRQIENANADKMSQIMAAAHIDYAKGDVIKAFDQYITDQLVVSATGDIEAQGNDCAFNINVEAMSKTANIQERQLPVYVCTLANGSVKYILPCYGAGLWGPIWGYIAVDSDGSTIYGAYFAHEGETPGLGAEIEKPAFQDQFNSSLHMFKNGSFYPIEVVKAGQKPLDDADYVDGISGGTITSKGVGAMINNCIAPYQAFLESLSKK
ncbi:MAG: NADH:ubiquinone reductase (Na(+)-transporting) subunit C [Bacteroidales bacterium]|nr:NADH:ubiquinone reductase (Na(+)-transporting) subunit C [Bacteroidales bacterium]